MKNISNIMHTAKKISNPAMSKSKLLCRFLGFILQVQFFLRGLAAGAAAVVDAWHDERAQGADPAKDLQCGYAIETHYNEAAGISAWFWIYCVTVKKAEDSDEQQQEDDVDGSDADDDAAQHDVDDVHWTPVGETSQQSKHAGANIQEGVPPCDRKSHSPIF